MKVLIDSRGLQAQVHLADQTRLAVFLRTVGSIEGCSVTFSSGPALTGKDMVAIDVLIGTTRYPEESAYSPEELEALDSFVRGGGGLLLMTNHGDLPGSNPHDMTQFDAAAARLFDLQLEPTWFQDPEWGKLSHLSGEDLLATHPIIRGGPGEVPVRTIVTNNCSSILATGTGHRLVVLSPGMVDLRNGTPPAGRLFAHALDAESGSNLVGQGRVVTVADSGFIGNDESLVPGPGLIGHGDNARFIQNVVRWLGGELD